MNSQPPPTTFQELDGIVRPVVVELHLARFLRNWTLAVEHFGQWEIGGKYVDLRAGYGNVVVLTDRFVIDVEADEDGEDANGFAAVYDLASIESVVFVYGRIEGIARTSEKSLTAITNHVYESAGPWWSTDHPERHPELMAFAELLIARFGKTAKGEVSDARNT